MKNLHHFPRILVFNGVVDFRKRRRSLVALVEAELKANPFENCLFVFFNRKKDCVRMIYWDLTGFAMWEKEFESEKFILLRNRNNSVLEISHQKLEWLLSGVDIWKIKTHTELKYASLLV
jgi:transposase